jgi:hypothetical protein
VSWWGLALASSGSAAAVAGALALRRRLALIADAEHELRGAATAIGLVAQGDPSGLVQLELERMRAALADLAAARGAGPAAPPDVEAGRLAQVLGNVIANAAEHGVGPAEVSARRAGALLTLEVRNRNRSPSAAGAEALDARGVRGRGIAIAQRAARELGGTVSVASDGRVTRTVVELPLAPAPDAAPLARPPVEGAGERRRAA